MKNRGFALPVLVLTGLASVFAWLMHLTYILPDPQPHRLLALSALVQWACLVFIWFAFSAREPLLWAVGAMLAFPAVGATVHLVAWMAGDARGEPGFIGFYYAFGLHLMVSAWLFLSSFSVFFVLQRMRGRSTRTIQ